MNEPGDDLYDDDYDGEDDYGPGTTNTTGGDRGGRAPLATPESRATTNNNNNNPNDNSNNYDNDNDIDGGDGGGDDDDDDINDEDPLEAAEAAAAAAEVAAMEGGTNNAASGRGGGGAGRGRDPAADRALMGVADAADGGDNIVAAHEVLDESGELVRAAFLEFLQNYQQVVASDDTNTNTNDNNEDDNNNNDNHYRIYPYQEQADLLAKRQLKRRQYSASEDDPYGEEDDDEDDDDAQNNNSTGFSNTLLVNFAHLLRDDPELAEAIQGEFCRFETPLRRAVSSFVVDRHPALYRYIEHTTATGITAAQQHTPTDPLVFFVAFYNCLPHQTKSVRTLRTDLVGSLVTLQGTVTRTSDVRPELLVAAFRCDKCGLLADKIPQNYHYTRPTLCKNPRCKNRSPVRFALEATRSEFVDWQKLRVQESSHQIPPGSMPRSMDVILRNEMVERCKAGDKVVLVGSLVVLPDGSALARAGDSVTSSRAPSASETASGGGGGVRGLAALGVRELTYRTCFVATSVMGIESTQQANSNEQVLAGALYGGGGANSSSSNFNSNSNSGAHRRPDDEPTTKQVALEMTTAQRAELRAMRNSPRLYEQMVDSIVPNTFGHREVKKGILLMLLGGVHKTTSDGIKLRGDINCCIIGDPSTAKSQFLKYVHSFLPNRTVYTSGKASSAAGLTAAVQRDSDTGEFCVEAGALMLADNGICCIDEFDKMDDRDQVAIHEAMEQQTISITKAGIQATLNARASILAAANPIYGRYDRTKTLKANVTLSAPILSRFDLFFVVLDDCNPQADRRVAQHILAVHRCQNRAVAAPFTRDQMRRYIRFARTLHPKITPESQRVMVECYRKLRQGDTLGRSRSAYRITVRQLESMVRLSEALARLHCSDEISPAFVREAYRLLKTSIIQVETSDVEVDDMDDDDDDGYGDGDGMAVDNDNNNNGEDDDDDDDDDNDDGDGPESQLPESQGLETQQQQQQRQPGEYRGDEPVPPTGSEGNGKGNAEATLDGPRENDSDTKDDEPSASAEKKKKTKKKPKKKKKKTKISFEEYESITSAIACHLRALEEDQAAAAAEGGGAAVISYRTWQQASDWYLEQVESDIGDSLEQLEAMRKKVNLVIRRLIEVDRILVTVGDLPKSKKEEGKTLLAVHPNYEIK